MTEKKDPGALAGATGADQDAAGQQPDQSIKTNDPTPPAAEVIGGHRDGPEPKQAGILLTLAGDATLFHDRDGTAYADLAIKGHRETWPIHSNGFKRWLTRRYYEHRHGVPNNEAMQSALATIEARAHFDSSERSVHIRVAELDGKLYLDLADEGWRAVEIDAFGWRIVAEPPARFRRSVGMLPLPEPISGGSIQALRRFLNVATDGDFVLAMAWLLAALRNRGPYPVLVLSGEHGSANSTAAKVLRAIVDPSTPMLRALPRSERDLFIGADNEHVAAFDNVSGLRQWISDSLCRLATGGGFATRKLYADQDEMRLDVARPIILNGIDDIVVRGDLADRSILLLLNPIADDKRRTEKDLSHEFEAAHPAILGALLDAVAHGLRELPNTRLSLLPRMADFAVWATACEGTSLQTGTFMAACCDHLALPRAHEAARSAPRVEYALLEVVAELVVGEAECGGGAALVEVVPRQRLGEELLLIGRDAREEIPGCRGLGGGQRRRFCRRRGRAVRQRRRTQCRRSARPGAAIGTGCARRRS
jgi:hypothetical protein